MNSDEYSASQNSESDTQSDVTDQNTNISTISGDVTTNQPATTVTAATPMHSAQAMPSPFATMTTTTTVSLSDDGGGNYAFDRHPIIVLQEAPVVLQPVSRGGMGGPPACWGLPNGIIFLAFKFNLHLAEFIFFLYTVLSSY